MRRGREESKEPYFRPRYMAPWKPEQLLVLPFSPALANKQSAIPL